MRMIEYVKQRKVASCLALSMMVLATAPTLAQDKPNILVIWGDDIGITNISAYSRGMMG